MVGWRSYRDQWLSEAFAEYSEILYTILRASPQAGHELIEEMRYSLRQPIWSEEGIGRGKLAEVGPLVLGRRLDTSRAQNAYEALLYAKGALVLRMLHFLFTDPSTGKGDGFTQMLADFVEKHRNRSATTEDFIAVANEHFATTQIARKSGLRNLDWFFRQWVYQAVMPSYRMDYKIEDQAGGAAVVRGVVYQENVPDDWRTLMPVVFQSKNRASGLGVLCALGRQTSFQITLPQRPDKVELDPDRWILSESTRTRRMK